MAGGSAFKITGLKETQRLLLKFPKKFGPQVVRKSLLAGIKIIRKEAKRRAPKATGKLRRGIKIMRSKIHTGKTGRLIGYHLFIASKAKKDPFYGRFQEEGWNVKGEGSGERQTITARFGRRTGRKTQPGKRDIKGKFFIRAAWALKRRIAVKEVGKVAQVLTAKLAKRMGL
jgi:hypothetical protein